MERIDLLDLFGDFGGGGGLGSAGSGDSFAGFGDLRPYWSLDTGGTAPPQSFYQDLYELPISIEAIGREGSVVPSTGPTQQPGEVTTVDYTSVGIPAGVGLGDIFGDALKAILQNVNGIEDFGRGGLIVPSAGSIVVNARNCPVGFHQPKNYGRVKKNGQPYPGSNVPCTRNRHMNVLNPKALMRATRRMAGFQHFADRTEKLISKALVRAGAHRRRSSGGTRCGTCRKTRCSC